MKFKLLIINLILIIPVTAFSKDSDKLTTDKQKLSYAIGYQIGQRLKSDNLNIEIKALSMAIDDVMNSKTAKLTPEDMQAAVQKQYKKQEKIKLASSEKNKTAGETFLKVNKKKKGVTTLPNGLQYKIVKAGTGKKPKESDTVEVHYKGTLINGTEFDSSYKRGKPVTFPLNRVIAGWQQGLQLMKVGAKWQLFIPSDLAYSTKGAGASIGPNETLIFDVELISITEAKKAKK